MNEILHVTSIAPIWQGFLSGVRTLYIMRTWASWSLHPGPGLTQPSILSGSVNEYPLRWEGNVNFTLAGMCDAAWCAPCTWAPLRWLCLLNGAITNLWPLTLSPLQSTYNVPKSFNKFQQTTKHPVDNILQGNKQTDRQTDRQTNKQTNKQTNSWLGKTSARQMTSTSNKCNYNKNRTTTWTTQATRNNNCKRLLHAMSVNTRNETIKAWTRPTDISKWDSDPVGFI